MTERTSNAQHREMPKVLNEKILSFFCNKYKYEIGHKLYKTRPCPRIRYVIDRNRFGYAYFGDFFFLADDGLYVWSENEEFAEDHNSDIVEDYFGENCDRQGYAFRSIFAGIDTGYDDSKGHRMFTGDIVMVRRGSYELGDLCLASSTDLQGNGFYGFPLDNHSLTLDQCKKDGYYLERIETVFFQLDPCDEPTPIWNQAVHYNNARCDADEKATRLIMAKYTPNFDKEVWKYLGLEIIGAEFDWNK